MSYLITPPLLFAATICTSFTLSATCLHRRNANRNGSFIIIIIITVHVFTTKKEPTTPPHFVRHTREKGWEVNVRGSVHVWEKGVKKEKGKRKRKGKRDSQCLQGSGNAHTRCVNVQEPKHTRTFFSFLPHTPTSRFSSDCNHMTPANRRATATHQTVPSIIKKKNSPCLRVFKQETWGACRRRWKEKRQNFNVQQDECTPHMSPEVRVVKIEN